MLDPIPSAADAAQRRKVLGLVQNLRALANGTDSPAEAASAAAKAQALLLRHNLDVSEVDTLERDADPLVEHKEEFIAGRRRVEQWRQVLLQAVAESCLCEWMASFYSQPGPRTLSFIGRASNVEVAAYTYRCLERQVVQLGEREKQRRREHGQSVRKYLSGFMQGVVDTIRQKLRADRRSFESSSEQCRAVVLDRTSEAGRHLKQLYPEVRFVTTKITSESSSYAAGRQAGESVELRGGINTEGRVTPRLQWGRE